MEWLFLTCHNYWIMCRLVRHGDHPYLAYSPEVSIKEPFRAFLDAILSVVKDVAVKPSVYSSDMELDTIEEEDNGPLPGDDMNNNLGVHQGSSCGRSHSIHSHVHEEHENTQSELFVCAFLGRYLSVGSLIYL
jgi:hypothetical protein